MSAWYAPSYSYSWCYPYGGCYNGYPYYTQFQTINVTPQSEQSGSNTSAELMKNAESLTCNMSAGLNSCGEMMKQSSELSYDAYKLGQKFGKLTTHFAQFSCEASKFMGNIAYPDFESVTSQKPTFDETHVWEKMNHDFERHVGKQEFLMIPDKCKIQKLCPPPQNC